MSDSNRDRREGPFGPLVLGMSIQILDEIESRLRLALASGVHSRGDTADALMLVGLVRVVVAEKCLRKSAIDGCAIGFPRAVSRAHWPDPEDWWRSNACVTCKVRRELEQAARERGGA